jgi:hypothetical protein
MRTFNGLLLIFWLGLVVVGCTYKTYEGKTVDKFVGKLTYNGESVNFPAEQYAQIRVYHESGKQWSIPIKQDGTFDIGWMPVGKYAVMLERRQNAKNQDAKKQVAKQGPGISRYDVPGGLTIEEDKTEYVIELGKGFKL